MEMEEDKEIPIILGRPFLRTAGALIDLKEGILTLRIGDEEVRFNLNRAMKCPNFPDESEKYCAVDTVDQLTEGQLREQYNNSFKNYPDDLLELQGKKVVEEKTSAAKPSTTGPEKQAHRPDDSYPDHVHPSEKQTHGPDEVHTRRAHESDDTYPDRVQARPEQSKIELKHLVAHPNSNRTSRLLEDLKAQQTVIENLVEQLTGMKPTMHMHKTSPADHHLYTTRAHMDMDRVQIQPVQPTPWTIETI